ncbi:MAG: peroxiredoxin [Xanthomonadaceae bacterium]|nr:peroxiredoxin [Xanthomonadaceae bacterium]MDE2083894.1 peroxiredoxin [Xanthomonadaceae bacterium]MDE2258635.1 peroxiredoxin [Xanthomonadaceae bacterium]
MMVAVGKAVPDLRGASTAGEIRLRELRGRSVIVYFYPKDATPGCTREAQDFRDLAKAFAKCHAIVLGVSRDSLTSHDKFREKQQLGFALVSDPDETWCRAFDVIHEKVLYGRRFMGVVRSTFLIGADGKLLREWRGVKVPGHARAVLDAVQAACA